MKEYIGDNVYAEIEDGKLKLTVEDGYDWEYTIYLKPEVWRNLQLYVKRQDTPSLALDGDNFSEYIEKRIKKDIRARGSSPSASPT